MHTRHAVLVLALVGFAGLTTVGAIKIDSAKNRPVTKVITLLKDMLTQMEKEGEEDEEVYETMQCWCVTNDKEKTKSIADATGRISSLQSSIEEFTAQSSMLNTEIKNLNSEIAKNQNALDTATALRQKQLGEFNEEEKDMLLSINSLKSATNVMSKQNNPQLLQTGVNTQVGMHALLRKHQEMVEQIITPKQRRLIESSFEQGSARYEPQSGEIFGILSQMKESFETNLANSQREETENQKAFEDLKAAKDAEIIAGQDQADTKTAELADVDEKNAQSKQDLEDTQESLTADTDFLANLKEKCAAADAEYEERTKARQMEIQAVSKALEFLSSDEAHDLFTKTFNSAFLLQKRSSSVIRARVLQKVQEATKYDPRMSALSLRVRLDAFGKVKDSIQEMVDKLVKEKSDDFAHKDFCVEQLNKNNVDTDNEDRTKNELVAQISDLTQTMDDLDTAIEQLKAETAESQVQLKAMGEEREKMNKEFQVTVADQRATQKLLMAALNVLKSFYEKAALVQTDAKSASKEPAGPPPPPSFKPLETSAASGGVMGMMQSIIDDAKELEAEATRGEADSQKAYESFVKDTNDSIEQKTKDIVNKSQQKAKAESDKVEASVQRDETLATLEQLMQAANDLHRSCDFLLKNFDLRASARDEEVEALKQAIAMFSGATFSALMQGWQ